MKKKPYKLTRFSFLLFVFTLILICSVNMNSSPSSNPISSIENKEEILEENLPIESASEKKKLDWYKTWGYAYNDIVSDIEIDSLNNIYISVDDNLSEIISRGNRFRGTYIVESLFYSWRVTPH